MIQQFLKLGGVSSVEEFYKKFPTEAHFDNHVYQMKNGGGIYAYGGGGSYPSYQGDKGGSTVTAPPRREDYMDNEEQYQADMEAYTQSLGTGPAKFIGPTVPDYAQNMGTPATKSNSNSSIYDGVSIVDLLSSKGKSTNYASRKKLAESLGMKGYTGKAGENNRLIEMINSNPDILNNYESVKESAKSANKTKNKSKAKTSTKYQLRQEDIDANPYIMAPTAGVQTYPPVYGGMPQFGQQVITSSPTDNGFRPYAPAPAGQYYINPFENQQRQRVDNGFRPYAPVPTEQYYINPFQNQQQGVDNGFRPYAPTAPQQYVVPILPEYKNKGKKGKDNGFRPYAPAPVAPVQPVRNVLPFKKGGQALHSGGDGTYYQGNYFDNGGTFIPDYGMVGSGELPEYQQGRTMKFGGPSYSKHTGYPHQEYVPALDWMQDGGSPLVTTQGQPLRNFMNTVAYTPGGWKPNKYQLPPVGPRRYDDGGMSPDQAAMMAQQEQQAPQQGGGIDPQQVMQMVAEMLQQGAQPEQVMQELVQGGVPQEMAQQIIQQVMQQMQGAQQQPQQGPPAGNMMRSGGLVRGSVHDVGKDDVQSLINAGYKIEYL